MIRTAETDADNLRDAVAWVEATIRRDGQAKTAIAHGCDDPVGLLDAITDLYAGMLVAVAADPFAVLARIREQADYLTSPDES